MKKTLLMSAFKPLIVLSFMVLFFYGTKVYGDYSNLLASSSQPINSSFNYIIQTLGTNLSGTLTQIDLVTNNPVFDYYGLMVWVGLYECKDETYGNLDLGGAYCTLLYSASSNVLSGISSTTQNFISDPVNLNPSKYYFLRSQGNNIFNASPYYFGSDSDVVDGQCFQFFSSQGKVLPCQNVSDIYFNLHGVTKSENPVCTTDCYSNVLFLPGLEASRLYVQTPEKCPLNCEDQLWEPNAPSDVDDLYLNSDGTSIDPNIYTRNVIDITNSIYSLFTINIYRNLIIKLDNLVYTRKINKWESFAYDWRQRIDDLIQNGTKYDNDQILTLSGTLQSLADTSKTGKVTIIAHSNGGLLAKALIKKLEDDKTVGNNDLIDHIDTLIMVASPQLGTPDAFSGILHGYKQSLRFNLMSEQQARTLAQNMPSAYGLLPSKKYFEQVGIIYPGYFASTSNKIYQTNYGTDINNYEEEHNFILGQEGRVQPEESDLASPIKGNSVLLAQAESLHDSIDNMAFPSSIKIIQIAGWGKSTITGIKYTNSDIEPIYNIRGDETVFIPSALYGQGTKYWLDLSNSTLSHKDIMEDQQLLDFITSIIQQEPLSFPSSFSSITNSEPIQIGNRLHLSAHSPITISAVDNAGNFTGKICDNSDNCHIEENIPGSTYEEFGEGKYITLAENNLQKVDMIGTDIGTFTFDFEKVTPDGETSLQTFLDIPVTQQTTAELTINQNTNNPELKLDVNSDGKMDITVQPNNSFDPVVYLQVMRKTIESLDINKITKALLLKRIDVTINAILKGKISKIKLSIEQFKKSLIIRSKLLNIFEKSKLNKGKNNKFMTQNEINDLITMLNKLLDNLN